MTDLAIKVENLSKLYRIGQREPYRTLRDTLTNAFVAPFRGFRNLRSSILDRPSAAESSSIWALKDISFEVKQGEVIGIIGRNGAGKSTLLKILSRITEPTEGYADIYGRVGSLLEVGTGFHPELTGRENIFLNGAILGMKKQEIDRKFDEIVAFAEVERFIDTPVKHYSSGMYLRLAFAVAAHLEPEILLVDEVLAVGDAAFQKKCLGMMEDVARRGRTVLFVSHNMQAIQQLCRTAMQLNGGKIVGLGDSASVVARYLNEAKQIGCVATWPTQLAPGNDEVRLLGVRVCSDNGSNSGVYSSSKDMFVEMEFVAHTLHSALCVGFDLVTSKGEIVTRSYQTDSSPEDWPKIRLGENKWRCRIHGGLLNAGVYYICPRIGMHNMYWIVYLEGVAQFQIILDHGISPFWNVLTAGNRPGVIAPILHWNCRD
jgi:lipopolysaccharide transport system ATP-binding protein